MYFTGPYLRVTTPKTTNGIIPLIINGKPQYQESFLPLTAKKSLEAKNKRLTRNGFMHLAAEIEVVGENTQVYVEPVKTPKTKNK